MDSIYEDMTDSEKQVAKFLKKLRLWWIYEFPVFVYDKKKRPRVWTPDFYLPKLGMYVEVCGSEDFNYEYRNEIFAKNGYRVIFVHSYKEPKQWKKHLVRSIRKIEELRHSEIMKMVDSLIY